MNKLDLASHLFLNQFSSPEKLQFVLFKEKTFGAPHTLLASPITVWDVRSWKFHLLGLMKARVETGVMSDPHQNNIPMLHKCTYHTTPFRLLMSGALLTQIGDEILGKLNEENIHLNIKHEFAGQDPTKPVPLNSVMFQDRGTRGSGTARDRIRVTFDDTPFSCLSNYLPDSLCKSIKANYFYAGFNHPRTVSASRTIEDYISFNGSMPTQQERGLLKAELFYRLIFDQDFCTSSTPFLKEYLDSMNPHNLLTCAYIFDAFLKNEYNQYYITNLAFQAFWGTQHSDKREHMPTTGGYTVVARKDKPLQLDFLGCDFQLDKVSSSGRVTTAYTFSANDLVSGIVHKPRSSKTFAELKIMFKSLIGMAELQCL